MTATEVLDPLADVGDGDDSGDGAFQCRSLRSRAEVVVDFLHDGDDLANWKQHGSPSRVGDVYWWTWMEPERTVCGVLYSTREA